MSDLEESCQDPDLELSGLEQFFNSDSVASLIDLNTLMSYIKLCLNATPFSSEARMPANEDLKLQAVTGRTSGGCLFTIPEFKSWTTRTGVDILKVHSISYRKSPGGWRHEFLEVSLEPDFTFASPATAGAIVVESSGHLVYYDVTRNVRSGLRFRIDRGQRKATRSDPPSTRVAGHRFAKDMVELIDNNEELDSDVLFTLRCHSVDGIGDEFLQTRVFDIIFVLERALETFGPDYALHSRNCWTFASFIIQSVTLLFHGHYDPRPSSLVIEGGLVRRLFPGSRVARNIYELDEQSDLFSANALLGIKKDEGLPISRNPFRVLLIRSICFCIASIDSNTSGKLDPNMASCAACLQTLSHSVLTSELSTSGMVSLLAAIVAQHLDNCTPACSKLDFENSHRAAVASGVIVGLFPSLCVGDNFGITPLHLQYCCRLALRHQGLLYSSGDGIRSLLLAAVCAGLPSVTDHVIEAFAKGIVTGDGLEFCAHVLRNKPSEKECICIANVFMSVCDAAAHLGKSEMLGAVAKAWFVSLWPKSTKIFLDVTSLISSSDAMMKLLVEAGILKDFIAILRTSSQATSRLTSSKSDLIVHCASTMGILFCAINVASRIHSVLYLEQVISAAIDYLDIWKKHWMPLLNRKSDLLRSLKEASDFQMKSSYDAILKGALPQAISMMWDALNKTMRLSGFHMIAALGKLLLSLEDPPSPGTHGPSGSSQPHPHSLELNQDLQKALDWRRHEKDTLAKMHHEKKWKRKPASGRKY